MGSNDILIKPLTNKSCIFISSKINTTLSFHILNLSKIKIINTRTKSNIVPSFNKVNIKINRHDIIKILSYSNNPYHIKNLTIESKIYFKIIVPRIIDVIAHNLKYFLNKFNYYCEISNKYEESEDNNDPNCIYIVIGNILCNKNFYSKKYIFYQTEQINSPFFTDSYLKLIKNAQIVCDYSKHNMKAYNNIIMKNHYILPMPFDGHNITNHKNTNKYDLLFFGAKNERRDNILYKLKDRYNIFITNGTYFDEKNKLINSSKIIINLHYYKDVSLELLRINESLCCNKLVISEYPHEDDNDSVNLYKDCVVFINEIDDNTFDIKELCEKIDYYLDDDNYSKYIEQIKEERVKITNKSCDRVTELINLFNNI